MKPPYAILIRPEVSNTVPQLRANILPVTDDQRFTGHPYVDDYLTDFRVSGYVDESNGRVYGLKTHFAQPFSVDLDTAEKMVRFLRRVNKGMLAIEKTEGVVSEGDYFTYLMRVAQVLKIDQFYVRNTPAVRSATDRNWSALSGHELSAYLDRARNDIMRNRAHLYD